ncbi:LysR family transcriptional regulator [Brenneria roseae subsp. roseae]|uniref:LysR family transcriptional regulator n=1 Tax=Brenneria roseae TaxID=1509241 RepID=UPI000D60B9AF|nr:LysR family transcriptional regulator [Brenneria roseae]PWC20431.1 LysR family transcriptional regulator [Brenneria roseae subsp. roseae]
MDLKRLHCFIRVAESGSFTQAALILDQSQSLVSRQVRQLEVELQQTLLQRNGRGVTLTAAGRRLLEHGKGILRQVEVAEQALKNIDGIHKGKVNVGMTPTLGKLLTVDLVTAFFAEYPDSSLSIAENLTYWIQKRLILGELDIALLYNPAPSAYLNYQLLWTEKLCLIAPSAFSDDTVNSIALREIINYPLIMPGGRHMIRHLVEIECARHGIAPNVVIEIDAIPSLLLLVKKGFGYAILPANALNGVGQVDGLKALPIEPALINRVVLATSSQRTLTPLAQKTIEILQSGIISMGYNLN